jgi:hypothetical protein
MLSGRGAIVPRGHPPAIQHEYELNTSTRIDLSGRNTRGALA